MITQDYIKGYVEALNHLQETLDSFIEAEELLYEKGDANGTELDHRTEAFEQVLQYIHTVKENYRLMVKKLNQENQ